MGEGLSHSTKVSGIDTIESGPDSDVIVVLIHGSLDRAAGMARLARLAQRTHRTIRFDRRGYGMHRDHPGPFTVEGNVDDVVEMINGRRSVLIGHSFGGNIALAVAAKVPDLVMGVTTYETPLSWLEWWPQDTAGATAVNGTPEDAAENFLVRMIGQKRWDQIPESTKAQRRSEGRALRGELLDLRSHAPWNASEITTRVLCGHGTKGLTHHQDGASRLSDMLPNASLVSIEGAGHSAPVSHPVEFHARLIEPHFEGSGTFTSTS